MVRHEPKTCFNKYNKQRYLSKVFFWVNVWNLKHYSNKLFNCFEIIFQSFLYYFKKTSSTVVTLIPIFNMLSSLLLRSKRSNKSGNLCESSAGSWKLSSLTKLVLSCDLGTLFLTKVQIFLTKAFSAFSLAKFLGFILIWTWFDSFRFVYELGYLNKVSSSSFCFLVMVKL